MSSSSLPCRRTSISRLGSVSHFLSNGRKLIGHSEKQQLETFPEALPGTLLGMPSFSVVFFQFFPCHRLTRYGPWLSQKVYGEAQYYWKARSCPSFCLSAVIKQTFKSTSDFYTCQLAPRQIGRGSALPSLNLNIISVGHGDSSFS